jgi:hypothetical protein
MNWLAPIHGAARLMHTFDALASMSDASTETASLLVLGLSLVGGGRIIRRLTQRATPQRKAARCERPSRAPEASAHVGPRRMAR